MKLSKKLLLFSLLIFVFISCTKKDDGEDNPSVTEINAADFPISGVLKSVDMDGDDLILVAWTKGKGKLHCSYSVSEDWSVGTVDANGNFSITLPGKIETSKLVQYLPLGGGTITANPPMFWTNLMHPLFVFYPDNDPSSAGEFVSPNLIGTGSVLYPEKNYGYIFSGSDATVVGTSANGYVHYNSTYKKGWNIEVYFDNNNVSDYSNVASLPNGVEWY